MRAIFLSVVSLATLSGCGLENYLSNVLHDPYERPASKLQGTVSGAPTWTAPLPSQFSAVDGQGNDLGPFQQSVDGLSFEVRLPSGLYSMIELQARAGDMQFRSVVPYIGEESSLAGVDISPDRVTEALILEARTSALEKNFQQITPEAFIGAREAIASALAAPAGAGNPTRELRDMVARIMAQGDPLSGVPDPNFFRRPALDADFDVTESSLGSSFLTLYPFDYDGDGVDDPDTAKFDAKLKEVAQRFLVEGCPSTERIRLVFTVDFNQGTQDGNCNAVDRFKWATNKPGKSMYFVGWIHRDSVVQVAERPDIHKMLAAGVPNQIPMFDDGTNGDEAAGDNVYTKTFVLDVDPARPLRIGYKYTWGTRGAPWTGSEEWPGNSRIIEVADVNGDGFVYRRDVFQDEATNKDRSNLGPQSTIDFDDDVRGCGYPEAREQPWVTGIACQCGTDWFVPTALGPITVAAPIADPQVCP